MVEFKARRLAHLFQLGRREIVHVPRITEARIAILREQVKLSLGATGGFHDTSDILKALLVGADAVQLCSVLFQRGVEEVERLLNGMQEWMQTKGYASVQALRGKMSYGNLADPSGYERSNYVSVIERNS